jgi:hypothetical protein
MAAAIEVRRQGERSIATCARYAQRTACVPFQAEEPPGARRHELPKECSPCAF